MAQTRIMLTALAAALLVSAATAADKFDPAAHAKIVAPFLEAQTVAVVHVDLSRVAVAPLFETLARLVPQAADEMQAVQGRFAGAVSGLTKLGVNDFYLVLSIAKLNEPPLGLLVLKPGVDADSVRAAVPDFRAATKRVGDVLVLAEREEILAHLGSLKPDDRPELIKAFEAAGDTAIQIAILDRKSVV